MTSRKTEPTRIFTAVSLAVLAVLVAVLAFQKQHYDTDIFWALKSGEWIVNNLKVPATDPFSYTFSGRPWIDFTWGFQVLAHLFFTYLGGWPGLYLLQLVLTALTLVFVYFNLRLLSDKRPWLVIPVLYLVFASSHARFFIRPHFFEYFFVSLYILLLNLYERKGNPVYLYVLFPLQAIWVNLHSSAILGIFIAGSYAAGEVIDELIKRRFGLKSFSIRIGKLAAVAILLPLASLVNPYGWRLAVFPFVHQAVDNKDALKHIGEWVSPGVDHLFFNLFPSPVEHFSFELLFLGVIVSVFLNLKSVKTRDIFLTAAALYMAVSHMRWVPLFAYFAAPVLVSNLSGYLDARAKIVPFKVKAVFALVAVLLGGAMFYNVTDPGFRDNLGVGLKSGVYPEGTVEFMKREGIKGNIYNEYVFGGYLIYEYPQVKAFIDGRTPTVYSPYFFWKSRLVTDPLRWKRLENEYGINIALIKLRDPFCGSLREDKQWAAVSFDDVSILYLKRIDTFKSTISRFELKSLNPCTDGSRYRLPKDLNELKSAREELARIVSDRAARPHWVLGLVGSELGGEYVNEAAGEFKKALSIVRDPFMYYDYGVALGKLKRQDEAIAAFRASLKLDKSYSDPYLGLGLAYYDRKDYKNALCYLNRYVYMADDKSDPLAYRSLGMSYFELADFNSSAAYLKRAAFLTEDPKELANLYYYTGNSLFEAGELSEAALYYAEAIKADPEYSGVLRSLANSLRKRNNGEAADMIMGLVTPTKPSLK